MQHKTITTLKELRIGDSFVFMKGDKQTPWRVTARADKNKRVAINQKLPDDRWMFPYDDLKKQDTKVMFLRHTIPLPGEECFMCDLKEGDVYHHQDDIIHEFVVLKPGHDFWQVRRTDKAHYEYAGKLFKVVFVRHKTNHNG